MQDPRETLPSPQQSTSFFGHPGGLSTLFFTEMWERFSYYGMRALLFLFMATAVAQGGLGLDEKTTAAIYGLYTMLVYLLALPGGWLADNFFGLRKSVFYGGCFIMLGHFSLAFPSQESFYLGLLLIVIGTGFLKPNISSMVGQLYASNDQARRDAGFSIFYMGINLGGTLGPLIAGYLGQKVNWHYGFAAAGIGMAIGLTQFKLTEKKLGSIGLGPIGSGTAVEEKSKMNAIRTGLWITSALLAIFILAVWKRFLVIDAIFIAHASIYFISGSVLLYFIYLLVAGNLYEDEKRKIISILIFFVASAFFYGGLEQQGSSLNIFADRYTNMTILGWKMPSSWLQSVPTIAVLIVAPLFAWLWLFLGRRNKNPSTPVKLSLGLLFMALGYAIMMGAAWRVVAGVHPLPTWLIVTYIIHTVGEACLYPTGLSAVTKLAPQRLVGQMMGIWFMSLALGNLVAGLFAGEFDEKAIRSDPHLLVNLFGTVCLWMGIAGFVFLAIAKPVRKLMGNIS